MIELRVRNHTGIPIIEAPDQFTHGRDTDLMLLVARFIEQGRPNVVFDLSCCSFIDSAAIGQVMECFKACQKAGGSLKLLGPVPRQAQRFIELAGLDHIFEIFDLESEAIESFN